MRAERQADAWLGAFSADYYCISMIIYNVDVNSSQRQPTGSQWIARRMLQTPASHQTNLIDFRCCLLASVD